MTETCVLLEQRRDRVLRDLTSASGDASLCSISKSAGPVPGIKYLEGRLAAVTEIERVVRRGSEPTAAFRGVVTTAQESWNRRLEQARQSAMSTDWTAYYAGGVDELADIAEQVDH